MKQTDRLPSRQRGFALVELLLILVVLGAIVGVAVWRIQASKQNKEQANTANLVSGPLVAEDRERLEEAQKKDTQPSEQASTQASGSTTTTTGSSSGSSTQSTSRSSTATPKSTASGGSTSTSTSTAPSPSTSTGSGNSSQPTSNLTRPTAQYCAEHTDTIWDIWTTDNSSHTYQVWENGGWVNKTETGTAARNFDTMQVVGVIPYNTKPSWALCNSMRPGYITLYYQPPGSVYTYNWLVAYGDLSLTKP